MYKENGILVYSPTDLTTYMSSPFAAWMNRWSVECPEDAPKRDDEDAMTETLSQKGLLHEERLLTKFEEQGLSVAKITNEALGTDGNTKVSVSDKCDATYLAMKGGADIIFQAVLELDAFRGFADFLVKVPNPAGMQSNLGDYHYEVWDTKLASSVKPYFVVQLCCYTEMLEVLQGYRPEHIVVALGNGDNETLNTEEFFYYYQALKTQFLESQSQFDSNVMPDPAESKSYGRWASFAEGLLEQRDHLSRIANISRSQIKKLNQAGISTCAELISSTLLRIPGFNSTILGNLKAQASIQCRSAGQIPPLYEVLTPEPGQKMGLALLPPHSNLDVFFDIEGYPLDDGGLEYLWGNTYITNDGDRQFIDFWAHNPDEEKQAFSDFIRWVYQRWQQDPSMHIYHYANYEIAACRKLMGRYGICEYEVDQLLRNEVFVDLYKVVKGGLLVGEPRYSIKNVEHLYRGKRDTEVGNGGDSIVVYEQWRELNEKGEEGYTWQSSKILNDIRDYNIDDCDSTQELVVWLRERQENHGIQYLGKIEVEEPELKEEVTNRTKLRDKLLVRSETESAELSRVTENLAWTLEFHRREAKPVFWRLFERQGLNHEDLIDDLDCLAFCVRSERESFKPTPKARNMAFEYRFDPDQEFKIPKNTSTYLLGEDNKKVKVLFDESDFELGIIVVQSAQEPSEVISLIPDEFVAPGKIQEAIDDVIAQYESGDVNDFCDNHGAIADFLYRKPPRIKGHNNEAIVTSEDPATRLSQVIEVVTHLDNSYLTIQGPPGSGKTFTGKHIIAELVKQGKKVGISSNSHKAINNLLVGVAEYCKEQNIAAHCCCTKDTGDEIADNEITVLKNNEIENHLLSGCVIGTTAWGFCRDELAGQFDYLFIDEAGQVSVAKLIGMSRATKNIILMGDQMQLGQPSQGTHPAESGLSILDYLLHDTPIIPENMGIFLGTTYRMHSAVNHYISHAIYEGKLNAHPDNDKQVIDVPNGYQGLVDVDAGVIFIPVEHEGNTQASEEEVLLIEQLVRELKGRTFTDKKGDQHIVSLEHMLFVAPYNHQVNKLKQSLGDNAKAGSVDKFQGQEAPIIFFSLCASDAAESARGIDFLFDKHRINVAISRAQSLAIVVGSPSLFSAKVGTIEQMKKVNVMSRLLFEDHQGEKIECF